jgi:hypothetical protein
MWLDPFTALQHRSLGNVLLKDQLPLLQGNRRVSSSVIERASGVLASRLPVQLEKGQQRRLVFLLPNATQSLGRYLTVSLLLADFVHRFGREHGPYVSDTEVGALIRGDLLLVTQHIRDCATLLRGLCLKSTAGTRPLPLTDYWSIEVLSKYTPPSNRRPRVFVANPGWLLSGDQRYDLGGVVIDASHPRTAMHLDNLLIQPSIARTPVQILVVPPWEESQLRELTTAGHTTTFDWGWDPAAEAAIDRLVLGRAGLNETNGVNRDLWICDDGPVNELLDELHQTLVGAMRVGNGRIPATILEAWFIYHRLRQLAAPLIDVEEARRRAYRTLTIKERLGHLEDQQPSASGMLSAYLDVHWPRIIEKLRALYSLLLERAEPAKFYMLACIIDEHLKLRSKSSSAVPMRIVVPTDHEANLLTILIGQLVDGWSQALQQGQISLASIREEPRVIAEGHQAETVLLGYRTSETRYLDVYPGVTTHLVAYPYEVGLDDAIQRRVHGFMERLQDNDVRLSILQALRLPSASQTQLLRRNGDHPSQTPHTPRASTRYRIGLGRKPLTIRTATPEAVEWLDIGKLAGMSWADEITIGENEGSKFSNVRGGENNLEFVEVMDDEGECVRYPSYYLIDVFYPATERLERVAAGRLRTGMIMVVLVDDRYEDLFQRMLEAIQQQRDIKASVALTLWQRSKQIALRQYDGNRRRLYVELDKHGLSVGYEAVVGWFTTGENEIIAPQDFDDYKLLASVSSIYTDESQLRQTFSYINAERVQRRRSGRLLRQLLKHIAAGTQYEVALASARALDTPLEQVLSAVSLREVQSVRWLGGLANLEAIGN